MPEKDSIESQQYEIVAVRRQSADSLLWQTPVLSLTAQAFLFTIALDSGSSRAAKLCAASLAFLTAAASIQLMARHRHNEVDDTLWLEKFELDRAAAGYKPIHSRRQQPSARGLWGSFIRLRSYHVWQFTLFSFAIAAAMIIAYAAGLKWSCG